MRASLDEPRTCRWSQPDHARSERDPDRRQPLPRAVRGPWRADRRRLPAPVLGVRRRAVPARPHVDRTALPVGAAPGRRGAGVRSGRGVGAGPPRRAGRRRAGRAVPALGEHRLAAGRRRLPRSGAGAAARGSGGARRVPRRLGRAGGGRGRPADGRARAIRGLRRGARRAPRLGARPRRDLVQERGRVPQRADDRAALAGRRQGGVQADAPGRVGAAGAASRWSTTSCTG